MIRFGREKRLLLGVMALIAPIPLPFNDLLEWPILVLYSIVVLIFLSRARHRDHDELTWLPNWALNLFGFAYLPLFGFDLLFLAGGTLVRPITHLLLFVVAVKLFALRRERDKWQAAIPIFFLFLGSMATSVHPSIALYLVTFLVLALWLFARFAFLHMLAGFGTGEEEEELNSLARLPLRGFMAVCTLSILLVAGPMFALLPRVQTPFIHGRGGSRSGFSSATGFSDEVTLDSISRIRNNRSVALRMVYEEGIPPSHEQRFRGSSFDLFNGSSWQRSRRDYRRVYRRPDYRLADRAANHWMQVWLLPNGLPYLMVPSDSVSIEMGGTTLRLDQGGAVSSPISPLEIREYRVGLADGPVSLAIEPERLPERLPVEGEAVEDSDRQMVRFAEDEPLLDSTGLTPRIAQLAEQVAGDGGLARQAEAIERHLMDSYAYSLDYVGNPSSAPLEDFLFERQSGHCEYFASAMVVMLRSRGIPARMATGFLGAEYNPLEGYYIVRQSNAHAWVEAYLPEVGWTTFDPTPPGGRPASTRTSWTAIVSQGWDFLVFRWDRYVLTYGFSDQMKVLSVLRGWWGSLTSLFDGDEDEPAHQVAPPVEVPETVDDAESPPREGGQLPLWAISLGLLILIGMLAWLIRRGRPAYDAATAYRHLRRLARRAGVAAPGSQPPLDFARRLSETCPEARDSSRRVVRFYLEESFAERSLAANDLADVRTALTEAKTALKSVKKTKKAS